MRFAPLAPAPSCSPGRARSLNVRLVATSKIDLFYFLFPTSCFLPRGSRNPSPSEAVSVERTR